MSEIKNNFIATLREIAIQSANANHATGACALQLYDILPYNSVFRCSFSSIFPIFCLEKFIDAVKSSMLTMLPSLI